jgi:signal transduction histidine kinase
MIGRLWERFRATRPLVDLFFAAPLLIMLVPQMLEPTHEMATWVLALWSLLLALPLVLRRTLPRTVFATVALVSFVQWMAEVDLVPANAAVLMALYTVAADRSFRWGLAALLVGELGASLAAVRYWGDGPVFRSSLLVLSVIVASVWILGLHMRTRRAYLRSVEERAARLERERDTEVQIAMAAERARIARELHDVVAHNVSVIVVQADGAGFAIDRDRDRAKQALQTISTTGRQALAEMRRMLGVLREQDDAGPYTPQPGVAQLTELVEQLRGAGLPLDFAVEGVPMEMSEGRQLTVFRIVQESLTNTLKHGGPKVTARVCLHYGDDAIEVRIIDDGRGAAALDDGRGHGLLGMRERAAVYGGRVHAAPRAGGGFEVTAWIPVREEVRT